MATTDPLKAYKEVRLNLDPSTQGTIVAIRLPAHGALPWPSRTAQKRPHVVELPIAEDETTFRQRYVATAASVYHRNHHKSVRSFLWRVLEDGKVLSIRAVDVSKQPNIEDANLTLRLSFPSRIVPACIALSDSAAHDVLSVFVLTESRHLYTLTLRPDHFRKPTSTEDNVGDWCKSFLVSAVNKICHRMVALTADVLLLSFVDGELLKLTRHSGADGSEWEKKNYNEGGWSSLRNFISFGAGNSMKLSTATSISSPATHIDGKMYGFMVTLDHKLRVWDFQDTRIAYNGDLLGRELEGPESTKQVIEPTNSQLVRVYGEENKPVLCVTYSPLGSGQFKFWDVLPTIDGKIEVLDKFPSNILEPLAPSLAGWTLADFSLVLDPDEANHFILWTLWKNNKICQVRKLEFETGRTAEVDTTWRTKWQSVATEIVHEPLEISTYPGDPSDVTEQWLEKILFPGRFSLATIETCLALYAQSQSQHKETARKNTTLPERLCAMVASTVALDRKDGNMDYGKFRNTTHSEWERFYCDLRLLETDRGEALSMVIDPEGSMPWIVLSDGVTAIRECSNLERILHNMGTGTLSGDDEIVSRPISAASAFRGRFSQQLKSSCQDMLLEDLFEEPSLTDIMRMRDFYDKCDFVNEVSQDDYDNVVEELGGGFKDFTPAVFDDILRRMTPKNDTEKRPQIHALAEFGNKLIIKSVQETVELHRRVCFNLLVLLVFIEVEINHSEDEGLQFETGVFFRHLSVKLKRLELINWLASTQISLPLKTEHPDLLIEKTSKKQAPMVETITILEGLLRHLLGLDLKAGELMPEAVTQIALAICDSDSEYETPKAVIQCFLLKHNRPDLAVDFSRFAGIDPFSTYIQGRTHLTAGDPGAAAALFKKAAFGLAFPDPKNKNLSSNGYLDETEKNSLNAGLPEYYAHIVSLFDQQKLFSFVVDFAKLALQFIQPGMGNYQHQQLPTDMHIRLFQSASQTARFDIAYSVLPLFTDQALQHSSLRSLVTKMCETSYAAQLIDLPFIGFQDTVDEILAQKCQSIVDVNAGTPYHKILYAWRIKRGDFRGAAAISLERLQRLQQSGDGDRAIGDDGLKTPVTKQYIALINALSCVDPKQAWILSEELPSKFGQSKRGAQPKRKVVTLEDIRKEYQGELDRIAAIENDQFAFNGSGDEMDVL